MLTMIPSVYSVKMFAEHGPTASAAVALVVGVVSGVLFVRRQRGLTDPMIDVTLFRVPKFRMAVSGNLLACFGFAGTLFIVTQYLQLVSGMSPLRAGLQLLPALVASMAMMAAAPAAARRFGPFAVIAVGLTMGAVGFALLTQLGTDSVPLVTVAVLVLNGGLGMAMSVAVDGILASVPPARAGAGASVSETANELGIALGTALLGSIMTAVYRSRMELLDAVPDDALRRARETLGAAIVASEELSGAAGAALESGARSAFVEGVHTAAIVASAATFVVAVWAAVTRLRDGGD